MNDHWLTRAFHHPTALDPLHRVILAVTVGLDFVIEQHPLFGLGGTFGFGAWFRVRKLRCAGRRRQGAGRGPEAAGQLL